MKINRSSTRYAALLLLVAMLFGCKKEEQQATPPPTTPMPPATAASPAAPVQKQLSSVTGTGNLDFRKRTDPFKPYGQELPAPPKAGLAQPSAAPSADALPIESFEVSKFRVVGIITGLVENRAQVIDPNGKSYVVQRGMVIGNNRGRISRITANSIEVVESFKDDSGRTRKRTIVLTLAKKR